MDLMAKEEDGKYSVKKKKSFSFFNSRGRVSYTDASFVLLTHGWGMELLCGVERFHHKNRKAGHFKLQERNKEGL